MRWEAHELETRRSIPVLYRRQALFDESPLEDESDPAEGLRQLLAVSLDELDEPDELELPGHVDPDDESSADDPPPLQRER